MDGSLWTGPQELKFTQTRNFEYPGCLDIFRRLPVTKLTFDSVRILLETRLWTPLGMPSNDSDV